MDRIAYVIPRLRRPDLEKTLERDPFDRLDATIQDVDEDELNDLDIGVELEGGPKREKTLVLLEGNDALMDNAAHRLRTFGGKEVQDVKGLARRLDRAS